jgi:hypothetical protein
MAVATVVAIRVNSGCNPEPQSQTLGRNRYCWKDSYSPAVVTNHMDMPEYILFRLASLKGFGPEYRIVTLVNTSTVTVTARNWRNGNTLVVR